MNNVGYLISLIVVALASVTVLGWQHRRSTRKIIRKLEASALLDQLSDLDEVAAAPPPDLRLTDPGETEPPPPPPADSWSVGRKLATVGSLSAMMFAFSVVMLHELPPQARQEEPGAAPSSAPAASDVNTMSLATTTQRQDVRSQQPPTTASSLDAVRGSATPAPVAAAPNPVPVAPPLVVVPSTPLAGVPTSIIATAPRVDLSTVQQVPPLPAPTSAATPPHDQNVDGPKPKSKSSLLSNAVSSVLGLITLG